MPVSVARSEAYICLGWIRSQQGHHVMGFRSRLSEGLYAGDPTISCDGSWDQCYFCRFLLLVQSITVSSLWQGRVCSQIGDPQTTNLPAPILKTWGLLFYLVNFSSLFWNVLIELYILILHIKVWTVEDEEVKWGEMISLGVCSLN